MLVYHFETERYQWFKEVGIVHACLSWPIIAIGNRSKLSPRMHLRRMKRAEWDVLRVLGRTTVAAYLFHGPPLGYSNPVVGLEGWYGRPK